MTIAFLADEPKIEKTCHRCHAAYLSSCRNVKYCPSCREVRKIELRVPYAKRKKRPGS
jgi:hypothetical protein